GAESRSEGRSEENERTEQSPGRGAGGGVGAESRSEGRSEENERTERSPGRGAGGGVGAESRSEGRSEENERSSPRADGLGAAMTARPPRASTRSDGKRPKARAQTQGGSNDRARPSLVPTDQFESIGDDEVVEETALPEVPQLRLLVHEG